MNSDTLEKELFSHRPFLLRLAAGLVGPGEAEDLVQDVWTRALSDGGPAPHRARAWLARVARNLAASGFRSQSRRERREREHAPEEGGSGGFEETAGRFELAQRIGAAVQTLEEPYKSVVLLRYFEGLEHAAIAAQLGVPLATVRTRQQRALAQLRAKLDREFGGREAWGVALGAWLTRAIGIAATPSTIAVPWIALGGLAAAGLLSLVAWRALVGTPAASELIQPGSEPVSHLAASTAGTAPGGAARERVDPTPEAVIPVPKAPWRRIVGTIAGLTPEELARTDVQVHGLHRELAFPQELVAHATPAADGSFVVDLAPLYADEERIAPQQLVLCIDERRHMPAEQRLLTEQAERDADGNVTHHAEETRLVLAAVLTGIVQDESGDPMTDASIEAFRLENGMPLADSRGTASSDSEGRFVLRLAEAAPHALALVREGFRPTTRLESIVPGQERDLGTLRIERGAPLRGTMRVLGVPQGGIDVNLHPRPSMHRVDRRLSGGGLGFTDGRFEWSGVRIESGAGGSFEFTGLAPREYGLYGYSLPGTRGTLGRRPLETLAVAPSDGVDVEFDGARVTLDVRGPFAADTRGRVHVELDDDRCTFTFGLGDGPVRFAAPTATKLALRVELDGSDTRALELETPGPGEEIRRAVALSVVAPATLHLTARSTAGRTLPGLALEFHPSSDRTQRPGWRSRIVGESVELIDGEATLTVAPGDYWVEAKVHDPIRRDPRSFHVPLEFGLTIAAGEEVTRALDFSLGGYLRVDLKRPEGTREEVQFRLLDEQGNEVTCQFEAQDPDRGTIRGGWYLEPWGPNDLVSALAPGDYTLRVWDDDVEEQLVPFTLVAGETTEFSVTLEPR